MKIRIATIEDAYAIAKVHVDSWKTTYKGIIPDHFLKSLTYEERTELWKQNIIREDIYIIVAENNNGDIIGFADAWKRDNNLELNSCDLTSIYLLEEYHGIGVGKALMKELFIYFKKMGYSKIFVDVLEDNNTKHFYEYYNAQYVKNVQIKIGGKLLNESTYMWHEVDRVLEKLEL